LTIFIQHFTPAILDWLLNNLKNHGLMVLWLKKQVQ